MIFLVFYLILSCFAGASAVSGFFASACSLPFDYVKTQIQKMQPDANGKYPYTGSLNCAFKTLKSGGPLKFYTGFPVYCVRIAPHVMVNLHYTGLGSLLISCVCVFSSWFPNDNLADDLDIFEWNPKGAEENRVVRVAVDGEIYSSINLL